jgi:DNA-binding transcriptional LysR family regulator
VAEYLADGRLVPVATATPPMATQLSVLSQHRRLKDPKVRLFTDFMAAHCRESLRRATAGMTLP